MMNGWIWTVGGIGFLLGMRHALDPDHVVAVSTIASEQKSMLRSALVGAFWGVGHALSLMCAAGALLALKLNIDGSLAKWLESGVAIMLVLLGVSAIRRGFKDRRVHVHRHSHDGHEHVHLHEHQSERHRLGGWTAAGPAAGVPAGEDAGAPVDHEHTDHTHRHILGFGLRPFSVGIAHGLAGSAGLAIIAVGTTSSVAAGLLYIAMLGIGSAAGMVILTAAMSLPLFLFAARYRMFRAAAQLFAGVGSVIFGFWWMAR